MFQLGHYVEKKFGNFLSVNSDSNLNEEHEQRLIKFKSIKYPDTLGVNSQVSSFLHLIYRVV
jgi:hypothetical protein